MIFAAMTLKPPNRPTSPPPDSAIATIGDLRMLPPILRVRDLVAAGIVGSDATLDRMIARGDFPVPGRIGRDRVWQLSVILKYLEMCGVGSPGGAAPRFLAGPR